MTNCRACGIETNNTRFCENEEGILPVYCKEVYELYSSELGQWKIKSDILFVPSDSDLYWNTKEKVWALKNPQAPQFYIR